MSAVGVCDSRRDPSVPRRQHQALDTFNTAMVSSIYYVLFTVCTITASTIMYKDWKNQTVRLPPSLLPPYLPSVSAPSAPASPDHRAPLCSQPPPASPDLRAPRLASQPSIPCHFAAHVAPQAPTSA